MKKEDVRKIGKKMDKSKAKQWVKKYQKENPNATRGWLFGDDIINTLLSYDGCEGIWFFKGINEDGEERLILFPADTDGNVLDKSMKSLGAAAARNGVPGGDDPADDGYGCPPMCPENI
ncbi:MAG: hypothetical protein RLN88_05595 [Ekhidna sp.]|uniref:hypothetical protein n=1 Tax=Ekhidna sp. TaxID=2608089 RepID=UPI0032EE9387